MSHRVMRENPPEQPRRAADVHRHNEAVATFSTSRRFRRRLRGRIAFASVVLLALAIGAATLWWGLQSEQRQSTPRGRLFHSATRPTIKPETSYHTVKNLCDFVDTNAFAMADLQVGQATSSDVPSALTAEGRACSLEYHSEPGRNNRGELRTTVIATFGSSTVDSKDAYTLTRHTLTDSVVGDLPAAERSSPRPSITSIDRLGDDASYTFMAAHAMAGGAQYASEILLVRDHNLALRITVDAQRAQQTWSEHPLHSATVALARSTLTALAEDSPDNKKPSGAN